MIAYDMVLEDLPERVRELTVRLRDLVLSLGPGIEESVKSNALEYEMNRKFAVLAPDKLGVSLRFFGPFDPALEDSQGRLTSTGNTATIRLASAADIDDPLRRVCRNAFAQAAAREKVRRQIEVEEGVPEELREALENVSRGLRLLIHHMQSVEKAAQQRARSLERQGQKRSHKKKPPPTPPPLVIGERDAMPLPPPPPPKPKKKAASSTTTKKKTPAPAKKKKAAPKAAKKKPAKKKPAKALPRRR